MADNYTLFSEVIPATDGDQQEWLIKRLEPEEEYICEYEVRPGEHIWVHSEEGADLELLVALVCEWQTSFKIEEPWWLEYAETCSKPRIGEFGGGAVFCHKGKDVWINTGAWVFMKRKELEQAKEDE